MCYGDISQEQVDPLMQKAMHVMQYSAQYLVRTRTTLREKEELISSALEVFNEEEDLLDLKIAKLRAREKVCNHCKHLLYCLYHINMFACIYGYQKGSCTGVERS